MESLLIKSLQYHAIGIVGFYIWWTVPPNDGIPHAPFFFQHVHTSPRDRSLVGATVLSRTVFAFSRTDPEFLSGP